MRYYKKLASDTALMMVGNFSTKVLIFLLLPLYTSVLSTTEYGIVDLFTVTISMLIPIMTLSISEATFRFAFDSEINQEKNLMGSLVVISCSGVILIPIVILLGKWNINFRIYSYFFIALYLANAFQTCMANYARGTGYIRAFVFSGVIYTIVLLLLNILFLTIIQIGLEGYMLSSIMAFTASTTYLFIKTKGWNALKLRNFDFCLIKKMIVFSTPIIFSTIGWWAMNSIDKYMIIDYYGIDQSGLYAVAQKIPTILSTIGSIFVQAWQISAISSYQEKDSDDLYTNVYGFYQTALFIACSILILFTKPVASLFFQKEYFSAFKFAPILLMSCVFSCLASFLQSPFVAAKKSKCLMQSTLAGFAINVLGNAILLRKIGVMGATYATLIGFILTWLIRLLMSRRVKCIKVNWGTTTVSIVILFIEAMLISYDISYATLISTALFSALIALHFRTIKILIVPISSWLKQHVIKKK